jgi:hypothetical protein
VITLARSATSVLAVALKLTACSTSGREVPHLSAIQCARAEADVRPDASLVAPLTGVTTSQDLAIAARKMGQVGMMITAAMQARTAPTGTAVSIDGLVSNTQPKLSPLLSGEVSRVTADMIAFVQTISEYSQSEEGPRAIGEAAQKAMRDIQAVLSTCAR